MFLLQTTADERPPTTIDFSGLPSVVCGLVPGGMANAEIYFLHKNNPEKARQTALVLIKDYPKSDMRKKADELLA